MKKLRLSLILTTALTLPPSFLLASITEGYTALVNGEDSYAYNIFLEEAEKDAAAAYVVGMMNYEGAGVEKNLLEAEKWLGFAALKGSMPAIYNIGFLRNREMVSARGDDPLGLESLMLASNTGNKDASMLMVTTLLESEDIQAEEYFTPDNISQLLKNLERDFTKGDMLSAFALASYWMSADEYGGVADAQKSLKYLNKAYDQGFKPALIGLAALYREGGANLPIDVKKADHYQTLLMDNFAEVFLFEGPNPQMMTIYDGMTQSQQKVAIKNLEKRAKAGEVLAIVDLANRYENGLGVAKDPQKAADYRKSLLKQGSDGIFLYGENLVDAGNVDGEQYIRQAASDDYLPAIHWLIDRRNFYAWSAKDEEVIAYEKQGAKLKDSLSVRAVIQRLITEREDLNWWSDEQRPEAVINQEIHQWGITLLEIAPDDAETYLMLGDIYRKGWGVPQDLPLAHQYYVKALALDPHNIKVLLILGQMSSRGLGTDIAYENAAQYYISAWNILVRQPQEDERNVSDRIDTLDGLIALSIATHQFNQLPTIKEKIEGTEFKWTVGKESAQSQPSDAPQPVNSINNKLLQELKYLLSISRYESYYAYLVADAYYEEYLVAEDIAAEELLELALKYYDQGYRFSEQGKLHYIEKLFALNKTETDSEKQAQQNELAIDLLVAIHSLVNSEQAREYPIYAIKARNLNEAERERAFALIFEHIDENHDLQKWVGERVVIDNPMVLQKLTEFATANPPKAFAQYYLAKNMINEGDYAQGYPLLEKAGEAGFLPAIYQIAGNYLKENPEQIEILSGSKIDAIKWYEKGAALKDDESIYQLAEIYLDQKINFDWLPGETDIKALYYYDQLSDPDYSFANFHRPDAIERIEALKEIQKGIIAKDPDALYEEARIYLNGRFGAKIDEERGQKLLDEAAELGSIRAMKVFYDENRDNHELAGEELERFNRYHNAIAESGDSWELSRLADRYLQGDRIQVDREKARDLYQRSGDSSYDLGYMYQFDTNLPLAEKGNAEAMLKVGRAYEHGNGIQKDHVKGYEWQKKAAEAGNTDAAFYFGVYAQEGVVDRDGKVVIEPDWSLALTWYEKVSPRFKGTVAHRIEEYEEVYLPATQGDLEAMLLQAKRMFSHYEYTKSPYYLTQAKMWAQKSIDGGNLNGYLTMMQFLPESEQSIYLASLLAQQGDAQYQYNIALLILDKLTNMTSDDIHIATQQLLSILEMQDVSIELQNSAIERLISLYRNGYKDEDYNFLVKPDLGAFKKLYEDYGLQYPIILNQYGRSLLKSDPDAGIALLESAYEKGAFEAAETLYEFYLPGNYENVSLETMALLELWATQFIAASLEDKEKQLAAQSGEDIYMQHIDYSPEYHMAYQVGNYWNSNGTDFVKDIEKAQKWYSQAFDIRPTKEIAEKLQKIAEYNYQKDSTIENLEKVYFYGSFAKNIANLEYPFDQLTKAQKAEIYAQVVELEDQREFGMFKAYVDRTKAESKAGSPSATIRLARMYENGREVRRNIDTAIEYYELAGQLGDAAAYNRLGNLFRKDEDNVTPNYKRAVTYFEKGAALGDSNTAHLAGDMHYFGEGGLPVDYQKAAQYYDLTSLSQGNHHALAKYKLAEIYYKGLAHPVTLEDYQKAYQLLLIADEYGESRATKALKEWDFSMLTDDFKAKKPQ